MIGLDTYILLRAATRDDRVQSSIALDLLSGLSAARQGVVNCVVLVELAWSLRSGYGYNRQEILDLIGGMMRSNAYLFPEREAVRAALDRCDKEQLDFADALIGELNRAAGCERTMTFDVGAAKSEAFELVGA